MDAVAEEGSARSAGTAMAFKVYETPYVSNLSVMAKLLLFKRLDEEKAMVR